ncbi:hypothetical protein COEREDRAFT_88337 [Coemansia reversa NRRL 1564]|uniref:Uncharacterized protein n=1 Tax=Coemansia reversa (strain ATCC 12441 / NRRL 1564) TaxID=763665 RepID=A0A2G5B704_COERN|nr:hypothetical protein COEREDRAFT_88337 [Coemansia reversa NRRL 1564]|eukprot:PIA14806.1 hypothetical protein COEREDRAFT_88337 [Coemansia reversa NRRL 1564]
MTFVKDMFRNLALAAAIIALVVGAPTQQATQTDIKDHSLAIVPITTGVWNTELLPHFLTESQTKADILSKRSNYETRKQLEEIYCPLKNCTGGRDWLTMRPNAAAGWALGSIAFLASGILVRLRPSFTCFAMSELGISLFLRAGLNYEHGNKRSIYIASLFFNYNSAIILYVNLLSAAFSIKAYFEVEKVGRAGAAMFVSFIINLCLLALIIASVVIMFRDETMVEINIGWRLVQAVLYIMVIGMTLSIVMLIRSVSGASTAQTLASLALLAATVLLALWSSFMLSRTYLPLNNMTRDSEVAYYLLNILPLLLIGIVF